MYNKGQFILIVVLGLTAQQFDTGATTRYFAGARARVLMTKENSKTN